VELHHLDGLGRVPTMKAPSRTPKRIKIFAPTFSRESSNTATGTRWAYPRSATDSPRSQAVANGVGNPDGQSHDGQSGRRESTRREYRATCHEEVGIP
jgi:hypothetical protein